MSGNWSQVGVVRALARFPLKGAGGEQVEQARLGWHGLNGDRRFALQLTGDTSGLPWASPREFPTLVSWQCAALDGIAGLRVAVPDGKMFEIAERDGDARAALAGYASKVFGVEMSLALLWSGTHDSMPISVISTATVRAAAKLVNETDLDVRRFRPNIVVDTDLDEPWIERRWIGRDLRVGDGADACTLRIDRHTTRCAVIDLDPSTGQPTHGLFAALRSENRNRAGVYGTTVRVGCLAVNAPVYVR